MLPSTANEMKAASLHNVGVDVLLHLARLIVLKNRKLVLTFLRDVIYCTTENWFQHCSSGDVIYYNWKFPENERHDSAVKRLKEALTAEIKLWEGYLQKVNLKIAKY